jgi:glutathione-regulated potassium-efflux system ancillary protein KefC
VHNYGKRSAEIELRFIFSVLLAISFLADAGRMQAIFGAFILGLVFSHSIHSYQDILPKLRSVTFSILSPAFFIRAGLMISLPAVMQNIVLILGLLAVKIIFKFLGTYLLCQRWIPEAPAFSTMLFSTGLTIGIITLTFGKSAGYLNQTQFSIAMISVILSALIPTLIARRFIPDAIYIR